MASLICEVTMHGVQRQYLVEQYYYREAELLDEHKYEEWLELFTESARYWVPSRNNRLRSDSGSSVSTHDEFSLFDDSKTTLGWRVRQLSLPTHWAENPRSRTRHLITNVRVLSVDDENKLSVRSNFLCYRNRMQDEVDIWVGERRDILIESDGNLRIESRTVYLDQSVILSKSLNVFF
jgi:biphenyl 2,3-dioxygenase beta subunit